MAVTQHSQDVPRHELDDETPTRVRERLSRRISRRKFAVSRLSCLVPARCQIFSFVNGNTKPRCILQRNLGTTHYRHAP